MTLELNSFQIWQMANREKLHFGRLMDIKKKLFTRKIGQHQNKLFTCVELPFLEIFKTDKTTADSLKFIAILILAEEWTRQPPGVTSKLHFYHSMKICEVNNTGHCNLLFTVNAQSNEIHSFMKHPGKTLTTFGKEPKQDLPSHYLHKETMSVV